tara:strand:- start:14917 stop:15255 length:339 start_codon:yes stop_codon:yes gene_type:complete
MENIENTIVSIEVNDNIISLTYNNDNIETIPINVDSYKKMKLEWLDKQPPFISDKFKTQMNNIILASIQNKEKSIRELKEFFSLGNEEQIKKFFHYMRTRDLTEEKAKWKKV